MSFLDQLSQFTSWLGTCWRGEAYKLLSSQLEYERKENARRLLDTSLEYKEQIAHLQKQVDALQDRILTIKGVAPVNTKVERKPLPQRQTPLEQAIDNGYRQRYGKSKAEVDKLALARAWKSKNLPGSPDDPDDPTNLDPLEDEEDEEVA